MEPDQSDMRGWIMAALSGLACILGSLVILVDVVAARLFGIKKFKIEKSNGFLSCSLSLSFGVILFSALYTVLPSAPAELEKAGLKPSAAMAVSVFCFLVSALGVQALSSLLHRKIPSHIVGCHHTHPDSPPAEPADRIDESQSPVASASQSSQIDVEVEVEPGEAEADAEANGDVEADAGANYTSPPLRRSNTVTALFPSSVRSLVSAPPRCSSKGRCYGFSGPCGHACFRSLSRQKEIMMPPHLGERAPLLTSSRPDRFPDYQALSTRRLDGDLEGRQNELPKHGTDNSHHAHAHHHHHVPQNAFLSLGLQTAIAIALHKLPEGFITYATNHVSPKLGLSIFLSLFIHNFTEGFAMALPLYLALGSRWKSIAVSSVLGGASQPIGAAVAAVWLHVVRGSGPNPAVYGVMFAVTSGVMASVALQLFAESIELSHSKAVCLTSGVAGIALLGFASALTM